MFYASAYTPAQIRRVSGSLYFPKPYRPSVVSGAITTLLSTRTEYPIV